MSGRLAMESAPRSAIEEQLLLPAWPDKLRVVLATFAYRALSRFELEEAVSLVLLVGAFAVLLLLQRKAAAVALFMLALSATPLLQPYSNNYAFSGDLQAATEIGRYGVANVRQPPLFSAPVLRSQLHAAGDGYFKDEFNRTVILRGVNVGGASKVPHNGHTHVKDNFYKGAAPDFVGRPIPLNQAHEHFARLASWGLSIFRLCITWESVEPHPRQYSSAYLDYLKKMIRIAAQHNISVFIDPHQDVWSRWTGGDGAPKWTLEKVGFDVGPGLFHSGASYVHQEIAPAPMPRMTWPTNYARLATATMFTLFFAGNDYAPKTLVDGVPVQEYLQSHYVDMLRHVMKHLESEPNVLGVDTLNEPSAGYVGLTDLRLSLIVAQLGHVMSGYDGMVLGAGFSRRVDVFDPPLVWSHSVILNTKGVSAWQSPEKDVWRANGVWGIGAEDGRPRLLRPHHFRLPRGQTFQQRYMVPFYKKVCRAVEKGGYMVFLEPHIDLRDPGAHPHAPPLEDMGISPDRLVFAPHFYDAAILMTKSFRSWVAFDQVAQVPVVGPWVTRAFVNAALGLKSSGRGLPVFVGETGIAMDLEDGRVFRSGDFGLHNNAMDRTLKAFDHALLSYTLWTYVYDNSNRYGDGWNGEDLSLFSPDQVTDESDLNSGGRALPAVVRPYAVRIAGVPLEMSFDIDTRRFYFRMSVSDDIALRETVLFIPKFQYEPAGIQTIMGSTCGNGQTLLETGDQMWTLRHGGGGSDGHRGKQQPCIEWVEFLLSPPGGPA